MKTSLLSTFNVDKDNRQITVEREFAAPVKTVWNAWTNPEILDQWWAPKPWKAETKSMDFRVGGRWIYAMVGPDGERHWAVAEYKSIAPEKRFSLLDAFSDEEGNIKNDFPRMNWTNTFNPKNGSTVVTCVLKFDKLEDLEKIIEMGFKEGFQAAHENLDELLSK